MLRDIITLKYGNIKIDLIIILNEPALSFTSDYLTIFSYETPVIYGDISLKELPPIIPEKLKVSGFYTEMNMDEMVNLISSHNSYEEIIILGNEWEFSSNITESKRYNLANYNSLISNDNNKVYILGSYIPDSYYKYIENKTVYGYWETVKDKGLTGGLLSKGSDFGYKLAYMGKTYMLKMETENRFIPYNDFTEKIDYLKQTKLDKEQLLNKVNYSNIPQSRYRSDPTYIWKTVLLITIFFFSITIIIILIYTKKRRSRLIIETEQQLYSLINALPLPIHARSLDGKYLFVNDMFLKKNYIDNRDDIINRSINNTPGLSPEEIQIFLKQDKYVIENSVTQIYETSFYDVNKKENKQYKVYKNPFKYYGVDSALCILDDITDLKKSQMKVIELNRNLEEKIKKRTKDLEDTIERLNDTQNELVETKKMASITTLVVGIAHEMNTPLGIGLTQITFLSEISKKLKKDFDKNSIKRTALEKYIDDAIQSVDLVLNSLKKTITMVNRFKEISIQKNDTTTTFSLKKTLKQSLRIFLNSQNITNIDVNLHIKDDIEITTFKEAFLKVMENLVDNTIIHGKLKENGQINITAYDKENELIIDYRDNGVGIDEEAADRLFDPFYTTNRKEGQIGLGLSIVYAIIRNKLKGHIEYFIPSNNKGLGLKITIPRY